MNQLLSGDYSLLFRIGIILGLSFIFAIFMKISDIIGAIISWHSQTKKIKFSFPEIGISEDNLKTFMIQNYPELDIDYEGTLSVKSELPFNDVIGNVQVYSGFSEEIRKELRFYLDQDKKLFAFSYSFTYSHQFIIANAICSLTYSHG